MQVEVPDVAGCFACTKCQSKFSHRIQIPSWLCADLMHRLVGRSSQPEERWVCPAMTKIFILYSFNWPGNINCYQNSIYFLNHPKFYLSHVDTGRASQIMIGLCVWEWSRVIWAGRSFLVVSMTKWSTRCVLTRLKIMKWRIHSWVRCTSGWRWCSGSRCIIWIWRFLRSWRSLSIVRRRRSLNIEADCNILCRKFNRLLWLRDGDMVIVSSGGFNDNARTKRLWHLDGKTIKIRVWLNEWGSEWWRIWRLLLHSRTLRKNISRNRRTWWNKFWNQIRSMEWWIKCVVYNLLTKANILEITLLTYTNKT